jgi:adenylate cyclase
MDAALIIDDCRTPGRRALLVTVLAPVVPQILGSAFNIWYNAVVIDPLLTPALRRRFFETVIAYNAIVYPAAVAAWLWLVFSLRPEFRALLRGNTVAPERLDFVRHRVIHLPWLGSVVSGAAWLLCIPVFLGSLALAGENLSVQLLWHLPISFAVSAFISITQSFFLIELATHWGLFPVFFRDVRADRLKDIHPLSLRARGLMWAISAGICPIGSLLLLSFAPASPTTNPQWFGLFVGTIGAAFGLCSAVLIARLVAEPVDQLRAAAQAVAEGRYDVSVPLRRADEFGALIGDFNRMVIELREKERVRRTFGAHVGRKVAEQILARDRGVGGTEQEVTIMFADIRGFTTRAAHCEPQQAVALLNRFLHAMVHVVEEEHGGMINKFLGDGFMAVFGAGAESGAHADDALLAGRAMLRRLSALNEEIAAEGEAPIAIGIGLNTGRAIVGSIGSPERMEFTVIGTTVNVASRVESLTKIVGAPLLLTDSTRAALRDGTDLREFPPQPVRGVDELVRVFGPLD